MSELEEKSALMGQRTRAMPTRAGTERKAESAVRHWLRNSRADRGNGNVSKAEDKNYGTDGKNVREEGHISADIADNFVIRHSLVTPSEARNLVNRNKVHIFVIRDELHTLVFNNGLYNVVFKNWSVQPRHPKRSLGPHSRHP